MFDKFKKDEGEVATEERMEHTNMKSNDSPAN